MRKVTRQTAEAFKHGNRRQCGNTVSTGNTLLLHGNLIAERMPDGTIYATLAGWPTVTTRERLNGLCELLGLDKRFSQSKHVQYFGDTPIGSNDTIILVNKPTKAEVS